MSQTILVTGGAGYVGSHACKLLYERGHKIVVLDNLSRGNLSALRWGTYYIGDIGNPLLLKQVFRAHRIDTVMHFAAFAYVGESNSHPSLYYKNNISESVTLLDAMVENGCSNLIFSSSCATYGAVSSELIPINEDTPQNPVNPYGSSKLFLEKIIKDYERAYNLRSVIFRYFNAAGCDPEGSIGEDHDPETHLIPLAIRAALYPESSISIFGDDYPTHDGTAIRDYVHVGDIVRAHCLGMDYLLNGNPSNIFNIGLGKGYSVREVIDTVSDIAGMTVKARIEQRRPGDPPVLIASPEKIQSVLGWHPEFNELSDIVKTAFEWERKRT